MLRERVLLLVTVMEAGETGTLQGKRRRLWGESEEPGVFYELLAENQG